MIHHIPFKGNSVKVGGAGFNFVAASEEHTAAVNRKLCM